MLLSEISATSSCGFRRSTFHHHSSVISISRGSRWCLQRSLNWGRKNWHEMSSCQCVQQGHSLDPSNNSKVQDEGNRWTKAFGQLDDLDMLGMAVDGHIDIWYPDLLLSCPRNETIHQPLTTLWLSNTNLSSTNINCIWSAFAFSAISATPNQTCKIFTSSNRTGVLPFLGTCMNLVEQPTPAQGLQTMVATLVIQFQVHDLSWDTALSGLWSHRPSSMMRPINSVAAISHGLQSLIL